MDAVGVNNCDACSNGGDGSGKGWLKAPSSPSERASRRAWRILSKTLMKVLFSDMNSAIGVLFLVSTVFAQSQLLDTNGDGFLDRVTHKNC